MFIIVEEKIKDFQVEGGIIALDEQAKALIDILSTFESQRDGSLIQMIAAEKTIAAYKSEIDKKNPSISKYIESYVSEGKTEVRG